MSSPNVFTCKYAPHQLRGAYLRGEGYLGNIYKSQYSVIFYAASAAKLNISFTLSLFNGMFGFLSNTSIIRWA